MTIVFSYIKELIIHCFKAKIVYDEKNAPKINLYKTMKTSYTWIKKINKPMGLREEANNLNKYLFHWLHTQPL